jgi:DNA-binding NtrC family response regulator
MDVVWKTLVATSDVEIGQSIVTVLARLGLDTFSASNLSECREVLAKHDVRLIFCGRRFRDGNYQDVITLRDSRQGQGKTRIVLATAYIDPKEYHIAKAARVFDVIALPYHPTIVEWIVIQAMRDFTTLRNRRPLMGLEETELPQGSAGYFRQELDIAYARG